MGDAQIPLQNNGALPPLDLNNIQGDILEGIAKKVQTFFFFTIKKDQVAAFQDQLTHLLPLITSAQGARSFREEIVDAKRKIAPTGHQIGLIENSAVNIAFSQFGLTKLGINDDIKDDAFKLGQQKDAEFLGDKTETWDPAFKNEIDGVILVAASHQHVLNRGWDKVKHIFHCGQKDASIEVVKELDGKLRPGAEKGHEHFGFNDGLSQPSVEGVSAPDMDGPVDPPVRQGIILLGRDGDFGKINPGDPPNPNPTLVPRPSWAIDGSFLAFRYLKQLVPEFDAFLEQTANTMDLGFEVPKKEVKDLLGARLVGRWKSGAPIQLAPLKDDPALAAPGKNQDFRFDIKSQQLCPYAAHIRKTNPRGDLDGTDANGKFSNGTEIRRIIRRGITFGPEVTHQEKVNKKSSDDDKLERGLLFACYQSNLTNGFQFIQHSWANNTGFPPNTNTTPGFDPLIGVAPEGTPRTMEGAFKTDLTKQLTLTADWVISRGGEYFFTPSISALKTTFSKKAKRIN